MWQMLTGALMSVAAGVAGAADVPAVPVLADTMRLTLQQAETLLQSRNLDVQLGRAALAGAAADAVIAAQRPNPSLSLNAASINPSAGIGSGRLWDKQVDTTMRLDQLIERGGKRELRTAAAQLGIEASRFDLAELERQQRVALYAAYYDLLFGQERERIGLETVALCERSMEELATRTSPSAAADHARINVDRLKALNDVRQARAEREKAQVLLAYSLGVEGDARRIEAADNLPDLPSAEQARPLEPILEMRNDIRAALARLQGAQKARDIARAQRVRDISIGVQLERNATDIAYANTYGFGVGIPLFLNHSYEGEIGRAEAAISAAQVNLQRVRLLAGAEIARARADLDSAIERVRRYDEILLRESQRAATGAEDAYEQGAIGVMDLLDARRARYSTRIEAATARSEYAKALAAWKAAIGERDIR